MAITTMDQLAAAVAASQDVVLQKVFTTPAVGFWSSLWSEVGNPGAGVIALATTVTGATPTDATAGAPAIVPFTGANTGYVVSFGGVGTVAGRLMIYDRIFHQGINALTPAATTTLTGSPASWSRVPGSNWGECELWMEINVAVAASAVSVTVSYKDGNNATQTATLDAVLTSYPARRMIPFRLANGTGIQSIISYTVGGTVAATGSFNLVVLRQLAAIVVPAPNISDSRQDFFKLGGQTVFADSCIAMMWLGTATTTGSVHADCQIANG